MSVLLFYDYCAIVELSGRIYAVRCGDLLGMLVDFASVFFDPLNQGFSLDLARRQS
jgi:hypothetical protein